MKAVSDFVAEALEILEALGVPLAQLTMRSKERMAKAFLAVAGIHGEMDWSKVGSSSSPRRLLSREVLRFMNAHLGEKIAEGSYDDVRRKDLKLPVEAGIIEKSAGKPDASTNDGTRKYALPPEVEKVIRTYGTEAWERALAEYLEGRETLAERMSMARGLARVPVQVAPGVLAAFSPGAHNQLQKSIIEYFLPCFGFGAEVLYVGDTAKKNMYMQRDRLSELGFAELAHDELPDVVAYSPQKNWLFLIEAVYSANPITEIRKLALEKLAAGCRAALVFVTAFPDRATFRKWAKEIAWESEVWIAEYPEHLIHFNGDKFLGPHKP